MIRKTAFGILLSLLLILGSCCMDDIVEGDGNIVVRSYGEDDFTGVDFCSIGRTIITLGETFEVTAVGDENILECIDIDRSGCDLAITQDEGVTLIPTQDPMFLVTLPTCDYLRLSGAGTIVTDGRLSPASMTIILAGSGTIEAEVESQTVVTILAGAGDIILDGCSGQASHRIDGFGSIDASQMCSDDTDAVIYGAGDIEIYARNTLDASVYGSGYIYYSGSPVVTKKIFGYGGVSAR